MSAMLDTVAAATAAEAYERLHPEEYYRRFMQEGLRPDGRTLSETRPMSVVVGGINSADGSSLVKIGKTSVTCGIKYEVTTPTTTAPNDGRVDVQVHLTSICAAEFSAAKPSELAMSIAECCSKVLETSGVLRNSDLCIESGKSVWLLHADVVCLNDDGNIMDAALVALVAALRNMRLPNVQTQEDGTVIQMGHDKPNRLDVRNFPVPLSFTSFDNNVIVDPTTKEEKITKTSFTVVMNERGEIVSCYKPGGPAVQTKQLDYCLARCEENVAQVIRLIGNAEKGLEEA